MQATLYAILVRQYSKLGELKHADEYFEKISKLSQIIARKPVSTWGITFKGVYYAGKTAWKEANQFFEETLKRFDKCPLSGLRVLARMGYIQTLEMQSRFEEAKVQSNEIVKLLQHAEELFSRANVKVRLMAPRKVEVGEEFEMRLDLVNIARNPGTLVKVEGLIQSGLKVTSMPAFCHVQNCSVMISQQRIDAFQDEVIKLHILPMEDRTYKLKPCVFYLDESGDEKKYKSESITVTAKSGSSKDKSERVGELPQGKFGFSSEAAEKAFNFLVSAFEEDSVGFRLPQERAGWRTLMEVVKTGHVSKHNMYGRSGRGGRITTELAHLGLIESRRFQGERGRGGHALKVRICIEKENVKQLLDRRKQQK
jgi:hypothetical protein